MSSSSSVSKVRVSSYAITGLITMSYFGLYTGYDKKTKKLKPSNLVDLVTLGRGLDWSLVECNKAISLSGLTVFLASFMPQFQEQGKELLFQGMSMLWAHTAYSIYKFYGYSLQRLMKEKRVKQISVALGTAGQLALSAGYWGYISNEALVLGSTVLGVSHFYTMEIDYKGVLQVRPYAYLPFVMAIPVLGNFVKDLAQRK